MRESADALLAHAVALTKPATRVAAAAALGVALGGEDLLVFVRDEGVQQLLPAPGFPQSLPGVREWRRFLATCTAEGEAAHPGLAVPGREAAVPVYGLAGDQDAVVVIVGADRPPAEAARVRALLPLLAATFRGERAAVQADAQTRIARQTAAHAEALAAALETTRGQLQRALADETHARSALEVANAQLRDQTEELEAINHQLQDQASEAEVQADELKAALDALESQTAAATRARNEREAALRRLADTLEAIADPFFTVDADWRFTYINPAAERVVRRPRAELIGRGLWEEFPEAVGTPYHENAQRAVRERRAVDFEAYYPPPLDLWTSMRIYPLGTPEEPDGIAVYYQDITARKHAESALAESEAQLRTMLDAIPALAWTARADGFIDWYNARWYEYTGTTADQMAGWGWQNVHDPEALPVVLERWRRSIATGTRFEMTFPLRGADGVFRRFLTRVIPVTDSEGRVVRWFGTNTDIEVERQALDAAEAARRSAEEANRAKSEFLSTMSHELRTPLNAIGGYTELLSLGVRGPISDVQLEDLTRIQRANRHLMGLITDILNFTRLEAGRVEFQLAAVPVDAMMADVEAMIVPQIEERRLTFRRDRCLPGIVRADPEKLRQILLNLLVNAIKFTDAGGTVAVESEDDAAARVVRLRVRDTGRGIPADQLERIFEPFVQIDRQSTHASQQGLGLGLAISRDLAHAMGGELTAESTEGMGSAFTLTLPRAETTPA